MTDEVYDAFISYSTRDNKTRWVSDFCKSFIDTTAYRNGLDRQLNLFIDENNLERNSPLEGALHSHLMRSRSLLVFLSHNYLKSEWCKQELSWHKLREEFSDQNIFIIRMERIEPSDIPDRLNVLTKLRGYDFFSPENDQQPMHWPRLNQTDPVETLSFNKSQKILAGDLISFIKDTQASRLSTSSRMAQGGLNGSPNNSAAHDTVDGASDSNSAHFIAPSCSLYDVGKAVELANALIHSEQSPQQTEEDLLSLIQSYGAFKQNIADTVASAECMIQFLGANANFHLPVDELASVTISLDDEFKLAKKINPDLKRILLVTESIDVPSDQFEVDARLEWSDAKTIAKAIHEVIAPASLCASAGSGGASDSIILFDFKNDDEESANFLMDEIQDRIGCDVDTLAEDDTLASQPANTDQSDAASCYQREIYEKLRSTVLAVFLKKDRKNIELIARRKRLREILRRFGEDQKVRLRGFVVVMDPREHPGRIGYLENVDLRAVSSADDSSEQAREQLDDFMQKLEERLSEQQSEQESSTGV